ncbi:MAG: hypothetical protein WAT19_09720 [Ferruginibacter sp.]
MRIGVISEGHADRAVISNIITGITGIDRSNIVPLRPIYNYDETDKALLKSEHFSSWSIIKEECESRELINRFFQLDGQEFIVIHIDTAEAEQYGIIRPNKASESYCDELRELVVKQINNWLKDDISNQILYAIAIEEIDAWVLTIYDKTDSTKSAKPKEKLSYLLSRKGIDSTSNFDNFLKISKPLSKVREIRDGKFLLYNCSLNAFYKEIETKVQPLIGE